MAPHIKPAVVVAVSVHGVEVKLSEAALVWVGGVLLLQ